MWELPVRKSIRLKNYDYSQEGHYFITICIKDNHEILWVDDTVGARIARLLSEIGETVKTAIENIPIIYANISLDKYVVMPNHIHMILLLNDDITSHKMNGNGGGRAMRAPTVSTVINQMKGYVTKQIGFSIWQKLFHDRIIRSEEAYQRIWKYIDENPQKWSEDCYFAKNPC